MTLGDGSRILLEEILHQFMLVNIPLSTGFHTSQVVGNGISAINSSTFKQPHVRN